MKTAYHGDKDVIRAEMNGVRAAIHILKHHASHCGTVQAVEVVHGRWMEFNSFMTCSVCDKDWYYGDNNCDEFDYCPNCGAKMDGDGDG